MTTTTAICRIIARWLSYVVAGVLCVKYFALWVVMPIGHYLGCVKGCDGSWAFDVSEHMVMTFALSILIFSVVWVAFFLVMHALPLAWTTFMDIVAEEKKRH